MPDEFEPRVKAADIVAHLHEQMERIGRLPTFGLTLQYAIETVRFELELLRRMKKQLPALARRLRATRGYSLSGGVCGMPRRK